MYTDDVKNSFKKLPIQEKLSLLKTLLEGCRRRGVNETEASYNSRIFAVDHELRESYQESVDAILDLLLDFLPD